MRSQFGPVMVSGDMSEVSLYLPGPRLLSYGMEQLLWAGGRHVTRLLYSRDTEVVLAHGEVVLAHGEVVLAHGEVVLAPV